jgi:hypothetical protein
MLQNEFSPVTLPAIVSDLIEIDGTPSKDFEILFDSINKHTDDVLIFQNGEDLLKWIFEKSQGNVNY